MKTFTISNSDRTEVLATIEAENHDEAAIKFARKGRRGGASTITAFRTTGNEGKSGMFKAYRKNDNGHNSVGDNFHVTEA